jgi:hypothetical protein
MSTLEKFLGIETNKREDQRKCRLCGQEKSVSHFPMRSGSWPDTRCADCKNKYFIELKNLKLNVTVRKMPDACECCGRKPESNVNLSFDHHYDSEGKAYFRGWLCKQCNSGIGYLGDTLEGIRNAEKYLLKNFPSEKKTNNGESENDKH